MKILYLDMDNVLVDFASAFPHIDENVLHMYAENLDEVPGLFALMSPLPMAIEAVQFLDTHFDLYILSTAPWNNPSAWSDKLQWIQRYLPEIGYKRLILTHNKHLNHGDYLVDDRLKNGVARFTGEHIHFGTGRFQTWADVIVYLCKREGITCPEEWMEGG